MSTVICKACESNTFDAYDDGFFYCLNCNTKAEDIIQTGVDIEDFTGTGKIYRKEDKRSIEIDTTSPDPIKLADILGTKDYYEEMRDRYVKGFLMMITHQCDALVEKFNVTPLIIGLVGPICLRFVSLSGVFDKRKAEEAILYSELQSEGEVREPEVKRRYRNTNEPYNLFGKRAITIWLSLFKKSLPLSSSLAISFLACHKAGSPVLPTDIVRWAREGKIPYLSCYLRIQEQMGVRSTACPVETSQMFRPFQIVYPQRLEAEAASIADVIGLCLPPVNFYGIASNYLKLLSIPEDKILDLVRLIQNWSMPSDLYLSKNEFRLPTRICVMSILIVAIRILYNINGFGVWERSLGLVDASEVEELDCPILNEESSRTKSADTELSDVTKATELETRELLKNLETKYYEVAAETIEHEGDLSSFLLHGRNDIFAGLKEASADDTYRTIDNLWNSYPTHKEFEPCGTQSKRERDWEDDLSLNQLPLKDDKLRDGNNSCGSHSRKSESGSMGNVLSPDKHEEKSKERVIRRLLIDMGENFFHYIPPRVKVKRLGYLQYVRKKEDGALIYAAHADYYILLRACALVTEIDVRNMHRGVLSFERRLGWIEKRIDRSCFASSSSFLSLVKKADV